jgi:putative oxidoreductase
MLLAAVFFYHGGQLGFGLFGGAGWSATVETWNKPDGLDLPYWLSTLVIVIELVSAIGLFVGFFTRLFALGILAVMSGAIWHVHLGQGLTACEYPFALLVVALSLVCLGGGRFSLDRAISRQFLPTIG